MQSVFYILCSKFFACIYLFNITIIHVHSPLYSARLHLITVHLNLFGQKLLETGELGEEFDECLRVLLKVRGSRPHRYRHPLMLSYHACMHICADSIMICIHPCSSAPLPLRLPSALRPCAPRASSLWRGPQSSWSPGCWRPRSSRSSSTTRYIHIYVYVLLLFAGIAITDTSRAFPYSLFLEYINASYVRAYIHVHIFR